MFSPPLYRSVCSGPIFLFCSCLLLTRYGLNFFHLSGVFFLSIVDINSVFRESVVNLENILYGKKIKSIDKGNLVGR